VDLGFRVATFDPPGAFRSTCPPRLDLPEMTQGCLETLHVLGVTGAVPVVGNSQATLCALHLALNHPCQVERLLLIGAIAGGARVTRADRGLPFSLFLRNRRF
jgi:pimeloyl-ACP methyl ester carboxylesterase